MMFFKRKKIKETPVTDIVASQLAGGLLFIQRKIADRMNQLKNLKWILLLACTISAALSIYFIVTAVTAKPSPIKIERVRMPEHLNRAGDEVMENEMPADIYQQIQDYKHYMDSLGQPIRKSLQDSMTILEQIYIQQQK